MDPAVAISVVGVVFAIAVGMGSLYAVIRTSSTKSALDLMALSNGELREENSDLRRRLLESDKACSERVSMLEGKVEVLQGDIGKELVRSLRAEIQPLLVEMRGKTNGG